MNKLTVVKFVVRNIAGFGASQIIRTIVNNNVAPDSVISSITVGVGSIALGAMVGDVLGKYTDSKIDEIATALSS